ncbi:OLC1v1027519C1 [Oldenlandia corymbosa var. corymbosa]|uniref:OLC1v1027519C1 n=1 Tax=Oldenlandia corymbosa var. corymbosa TaxID=529605 RepID=A0AAV1CCE3_OLDCO|nr:OLC1v1027519C1 [Oldenlandia corymbosa var. corymbosa]
MAVPDAAVSFLLDNLSQVLVYNVSLVANVKENILKLQQELLTLKGLMKDFSKYNHDSEFLKQTVNEIRGILGEAEDAVDAYLLQAAVQKSRNWASKAFHQITDYPIVLRDVGKQIEEVGLKVKRINEEKVKNGFEVLQYQAIVKLNQSGSSEAPKVEEDHVIGFDGPAEDVEKLLTQGPEKLEVISIVGMLGLGKTTLAKKVYKDPDVDYEYMIRAFVYVSQDYDKREVLLKILASFTQMTEEVSKMDVEQLEKYLYKQLEGKQYLIVLDDVWDPKDWDRFKDVFPNNNKRCRVLITTRYDRVAEHANRNTDSIYRLKFLELGECRELLRWRVFQKNDCAEELQEFEIEIARKCDGLPLAVVVIAGIIVNHRDRVDWWKDVANSVKDYIARDTTQTTKVIELMYNRLPNHLKPCFLYLGVFREDFEIPVWKLVRLWISEGLIQQEGNFNLEDMAEVYLEELVYRNLVMVGTRRANDRIKTCRMHDTLREFCKKEAAEENLFQEIRKDNWSTFTSGAPILDQYRRMCINNVNILDYISGTPSGKCIRSFLTFVKEETPVEPKLVSSIPKTFKLLRVLEIQSLIFTRFPVDLCNLVLLKYIAISSNFSSLPSSLSTLWNLQTLIVNTTCRTLDIKADLWKMPHFRHLHTNAATILPSPSPKSQKNKEDSSTKSMQTLCTISPGSCKKEVFERAPNLRKLGICGMLTKLFEVNGESSLLPHLRKLESLQNLKLLNDDISNKLYSLPSKSSFPPSLTKLTLLNTLLEWKEMRTLGELESLEVLKLKEYAFQGKLWQTEKGGFRRLKHLYIGHTDLVVWEASVDHFPKLKSLELNGCDKLQAIPHGLADISTLEMVVLHCTNPQVASSARRLQVLRLEQAKKGTKVHKSFKVSVYPPEH